MKRILLFLSVISLSAVCLAQDATVNDPVPLAPKDYRRPADYDPVPFRYKYSLRQMRENFSDEMMARAAKEYARMEETFATGKWKPTAESIDQHQTPEWFRDVKFGMFIDWGLWSIGGYATKMEHEAMYPDWYEYRMVDDGRPYKSNHISLIPYHYKNWGEDIERGDFIPLFKASRYDAEALVDLAVASGMRYIVPFCKHFSGFCIWPSSYTHMDVGDRLGKDLIAPMVAACRKHDLKFGFYYGQQEWEYPIIGDNDRLLCRTWFRGNTTIGDYDSTTLSATSGHKKRVSIDDWENVIPGKIPVRNFLKDYLIPQAIEFIDRYDPDILWYDGEWTDPIKNLGSYEMAAYLYNHAEGRKEVAVNDRYGQENGKGVRRKRGDIYTSEYGYTGQGIVNMRPWMQHAWEENRSISQSFGFNWTDTEKNVLSPQGLVDMLVNVVAAGGNLLLMINLDAQGAVPQLQKSRLQEIGKWLKVNGEGIYATRTYSTISEGKIRYTRSKDSRTVYAITLEWPGDRVELKAVTPAADSKVYMLGYKEPLKWHVNDGTTTIELPAKLQKEGNRPCKYAYTFRIERE